MNVYVLSTLEIGADYLDIFQRGMRIAGVIGLSKRRPTDSISGYRYLKGYCEANGLSFIEVDDYALNSDADRQRLAALDIDLLIIAGWQRLIPEWLIAQCRLCAIGSHGSTRGITGGRGRSPQNWALLLGKKEFFISIFRVTGGIDSGGVFDTRRFVLSELDDIKTSYYKATWLTAYMILENIRNGSIPALRFEEQTAEPKYLPQRLPGDGAVDWSRNTSHLYDFVRALTRPYPGAFSYVDDRKVTIWRARPFEVDGAPSDFRPGEIATVFSGGELLVKTGDGFLLVETYSCDGGEAEPALAAGMQFAQHDFGDGMREIIERHQEKYPGLPIADDILEFR
jgi:UDP-4-amino-4-deoxy-L-arabinose formyltransferase/UDP-glucuronic acid dehydrogenase (UDP-4-keto-hexauronic acid decarboxylating)